MRKYVLVGRRVEVEFKPHLGKVVVHVFQMYLRRGSKEVRTEYLGSYTLSKRDLEKLCLGEIPKKLIKYGTYQEYVKLHETLMVKINPHEVLAELLRQEEKLRQALEKQRKQQIQAMRET